MSRDPRLKWPEGVAPIGMEDLNRIGIDSERQRPSRPLPIRHADVLARSPGTAPNPPGAVGESGPRSTRDEVPNRLVPQRQFDHHRQRIRHEAHHVARIGEGGWKDWSVVRSAASGDFVLVINNASDFRRLYATTPLHAGLINIVPNVNRNQLRTD